MRARKGSVGLIVFYGLLMVLCWQTPAHAASIPPTIDQIVGTYSVNDAETWYEFDVGLPGKTRYALTWHITQTSESTVQVYIDEWDWLFTAYYKNGFLVQSSGNVSSGTAFWGALGIATFSGKPGKVKFKGDFGWGQFGSGWNGDEYWEWDPYSGKMTSAGPGSTVGAARAGQGDEQAASAPGEGEVPLAIGSHPSIDDLPGTYSCTLARTVYSLTAGTKEKEKEPDTLTITKIDDSTLNLHSSGGDMYTHYGSGVLMLANVDNDTLVPDALLGLLLAKGKPGKISLKGKVHSVSELETPNERFVISTVSCKQSSP